MGTISNLEKSLSYAWSFRHAKPFIYLFVLALFGIGVLAAVALGAVSGVLTNPSEPLTLAPAALGLLILLGLLMIAAFVIGSLLATATVILESQGRRNAFREARKKLLGLVGVAIVAALLSMFVNLAFNLLGEGTAASLVHTAAIIALSCAVLFSQYYLVLRGRKVLDSVSASINLFAKKPLGVLAAAITLMVIMLMLLVVSAVPIVLAAAYAASGASVPVAGILVLLGIAWGVLGLSYAETTAAAFLARSFGELDRKR